MFQLTKTRAANYADLSPVNRTGFMSVADPINCVVETAAGVADATAAVEAEAAGAGADVFTAVVQDDNIAAAEEQAAIAEANLAATVNDAFAEFAVNDLTANANEVNLIG